MLAGLTIHLQRRREALVERLAYLDMQESRARDIEVGRAFDMQTELSELAKMGVDMDRIRMIEPGVYVEDDSDSDGEI